MISTAQPVLQPAAAATITTALLLQILLLFDTGLKNT